MLLSESLKEELVLAYQVEAKKQRDNKAKQLAELEFVKDKHSEELKDNDYERLKNNLLASLPKEFNLTSLTRLSQTCFRHSNFLDQYDNLAEVKDNGKRESKTEFFIRIELFDAGYKEVKAKGKERKFVKA